MKNNKKIRSYLTSNMLEKLLKQEGLNHDRDWSEDWMLYENFEDFYTKNSRLFLVAFSKLEMLVAAVLKNYFMTQLSVLIQRTGQNDPEGYPRASECIAMSVAENYIELEQTLKERWPRQYADLVRRNSSPAFL